MNLQTAWRTNTPSLLRVLRDGVKYRRGASTPCSAETFEVAWGSYADDIVIVSMVRIGRFRVDREGANLVNFRSESAGRFDAWGLLE